MHIRIKRSIYFFLALAATSGLIWKLQQPLALGDKTIPPIGDFFNPFSGFWRNAESLTGKPGTSLAVNIPNLKGEVQVIYDELMVPHIFAQNTEDAMTVQGYVTAQHRLWQMDMMTRKASGRLSEVLGTRTVELDRLVRRKGMVAAAEKDVEGWKAFPEHYKLVEAYTNGVNAYLTQLSPADYPIEFKLLNYKPEPWTTLKTALVTESMSENLVSREDDLASTNALAHFGKATFDFLYPEYNPKMVPIVTDEGQWKGINPQLPASTENTAKGMTFNSPANTEVEAENELNPWLLADETIQPYRYLKGSNNWALAATKTANKQPILCNDPHLDLTLPSIWYQVQVHTPNANSYGVTIPGIPGIIIGFNENIAWGMTNVSHDVLDWYEIKWTDESKSAYLLDGQVQKVNYKVEEIKVKGQPTLMDTVRYTNWGPVTYDFKPDHPLKDCAIHWVIKDKPEKDQLGMFTMLNAGKDFQDYGAAIQGFDNPAQNLIVATRSGDIGITVQGRLPIRKPQQGRFIQDGSLLANDWQGFIPQEHLPITKNPARGYVFSANQNSTPPSYPYYYLGEFEDWRNLRINDRLSNMQNATIDSMKSMQMDNYSQLAANALPVMLRLLRRENLDAASQALVADLEKWHYVYDKNLTAPTLFDNWFDSCYVQTWDEMYSLHKKSTPMLFPEHWRFIELMDKDTSNVFFDHPNTPARENARDIATESFQKMAAMASKALPGALNWGKALGFHLNHLGFIKPFGREGFEIGGVMNAPNAISETKGPSWRMIVELGPTVRALGVFPGGQSGNPGSPYYDNMVNAWANGEYYDLKLLKTPEELATPQKKIVFKAGK